jgi:predicted amidohydrolase
MNSLPVALVQLDAGSNKQKNLDKAIQFIEAAAEAGAKLVALPENFHIRGSEEHNQLKLEAAEAIPGVLSDQLASIARRLSIYLLAGSFGERAGQPDKIYNTSLLFDHNGSIIAKYRKIHLFDVTIGDHVVTKESSRVKAGDTVVTADTEFGRVGLSVCYDVRFPELYRSHALMGAIISFVPANFTLYTGKDHWETLLRARAIENSMYILAPAQIGRVPSGHQTYGRSMVVDPWGTVIACAPDNEGVAMAILDLDAVSRVRARVPSLEHRRPESYQIKRPTEIVR